MPELSINGARLHYELQGEGSSVVLLVHGLGSCAEDWEAQLPALTPHYRVLSVDLRGHGRSDQSLHDYSMRSMSEDLAQLLQALKLGPVHAVGISMGGVLVCRLAAHYPQLLRSAVIVNSAPEVMPSQGVTRWTLAKRSALITLLGLPRFGRLLADKLFPEPRNAIAKQQFVQRFARHNRRRPYLASLYAVMQARIDYAPEQLSCPLLMIAGDQDYTPVAYKNSWVQRLPRAELAVVPGAHHALPAEYPEQFNALLLDFLARQASAARA